MITISVCMIVKNEEKVLARCLDSLLGIADEIIIVDTGSTDATRQIAERYTDKVYDFTWVDDFSAARNFSFSKASMEYIYVADADEILEKSEWARFVHLKMTLDHSVEIVQMLYTNQLEHGTTYNFDEELRPKLYKRLRDFVWCHPLHETVRLEPVILDTDIRIRHAPQHSHAGRDFSMFRRAIQRDGGLSEHLVSMYARELMISGTASDFEEAIPFFKEQLEQGKSDTAIRQALCVLTRGARLTASLDLFFASALKNVALGKASSEVCFELGEYYYFKNDIYEAQLWYYNAIYETEPELDLAAAENKPAARLAECYEAQGNAKEAAKYREVEKEFLEKRSQHGG